MESKFRILERKYDSHTEYHPQMFFSSETVKPSKIQKFFGAKNIISPEIWVSLLVGTIDYNTGKSSKYEAELVIDAFKRRDEKVIEEIIHEIK